jgi:hypothetical protein
MQLINVQSIRVLFFLLIFFNKNVTGPGLRLPIIAANSAAVLIPAQQKAGDAVIKAGPPLIPAHRDRQGRKVFNPNQAQRVAAFPLLQNNWLERQK